MSRVQVVNDGGGQKGGGQEVLALNHEDMHVTFVSCKEKAGLGDSTISCDREIQEQFALRSCLAEQVDFRISGSKRTAFSTYCSLPLRFYRTFWKGLSRHLLCRVKQQDKFTRTAIDYN